ncbi:hypothetical protein FQN57_003537 [Myotisia sp. PD_48]|nr:hypothetical protein FQN57_003537 [Myotisia sp. PD_48]
MTLLFVSQPALATDILGLPLRSYIKAHGAVGQMTFIQALVHVIISLKLKRFSAKEPTQLNGLLAVSTLGMIFVLLLLRKHFYELFIKTHYILGFFTLYGLWRHIMPKKTFSQIYMSLTVGFIACTILWQMLNMLLRNFGFGRYLGRATVISQNGVLNIHVSKITSFQHKPGQFVYIRMMNMSPLSPFHSHPFMIVWCDTEKHGYTSSIYFLAKVRKGFTAKLLEATKKSSSYLACVEGPYGDSIDFSQYGCILMIATGIGIAAQIPYLKAILECDSRWSSPIKSVRLVWEVDHTDQLHWVFDWMQELLNRDKGRYIVRISIYVPHSIDDPESYGNHGRILIVPKTLNIQEALNEEIKLRRGRLLVTVAANKPVRDMVRGCILARMPQLGSRPSKNANLRENILKHIRLMEEAMAALIESVNTLEKHHGSIHAIESNMNGMYYSIESLWKCVSLSWEESEVGHVQAIDFQELPFQPND